MCLSISALGKLRQEYSEFEVYNLETVSKMLMLKVLRRDDPEFFGWSLGHLIRRPLKMEEGYIRCQRDRM